MTRDDIVFVLGALALAFALGAALGVYLGQSSCAQPAPTAPAQVPHRAKVIL